MHDGVAIDDEPADIGFLKKLIDARGIGALRQPDAAGRATEAFLIMVLRNHDLRANGLRVFGHEGQKTVRCAAGDDFQLAGILEFAERGEEIAVIFINEDVAAIFRADADRTRRVRETGDRPWCG